MRSRQRWVCKAAWTWVCEAALTWVCEASRGGCVKPPDMGVKPHVLSREARGTHPQDFRPRPHRTAKRAQWSDSREYTDTRRGALWAAAYNLENGSGLMSIRTGPLRTEHVDASRPGQHGTDCRAWSCKSFSVFLTSEKTQSGMQSVTLHRVLKKSARREGTEGDGGGRRGALQRSRRSGLENGRGNSDWSSCLLLDRNHGPARDRFLEERRSCCSTTWLVHVRPAPTETPRGVDGPSRRQPDAPGRPALLLTTVSSP